MYPHSQEQNVFFLTILLYFKTIFKHVPYFGKKGYTFGAHCIIFVVLALFWHLFIKRMSLRRSIEIIELDRNIENIVIEKQHVK